ncbi:MAG: YHYH protein [Nocardioides sp.]
MLSVSSRCPRRVSLLSVAVLLIAGCGGTAADDVSTATDADESTASASASGEDSSAGGLAARSEAILAAQWSDNVSISIDGPTATFESDGVPSHEILDTYLADGKDGKYVAGGVEAYDARFSFPVVPTEADSAQDTGNGAIGVAISGAVFFNPYEGDGSGTVANDDNSTIDGVPFIDACGGHPLPNAISYHYHGIPFCITDEVDTPGEHSAVIGYLFDGYGIYGPQDDGGEEPTDLDECMGHVGPTPDFPEGVYHYHVSSRANYISECFHGEAATSRRP